MSNVIAKKRKCGLFRKLAIGTSVVSAMIGSMATTVSASFSDSVTVNNNDVDASTMMGKIIGVLLTITRFVGVALIVYGIYEIVMSFMQNQPEAKTKGIIMALAGVLMTALKSILQAIGVIA